MERLNETDAEAVARDALNESVIDLCGAEVFSACGEAYLVALDAYRAAVAEAVARRVRAECAADTRRLDWLERQAKDGEFDDWEKMWYSPLLLRVQADRLMEAP